MNNTVINLDSSSESCEWQQSLRQWNSRKRNLPRGSNCVVTNKKGCLTPVPERDPQTGRGLPSNRKPLGLKQMPSSSPRHRSKPSPGLCVLGVNLAVSPSSKENVPTPPTCREAIPTPPNRRLSVAPRPSPRASCTPRSYARRASIGVIPQRRSSAIDILSPGKKKPDANESLNVEDRLLREIQSNHGKMDRVMMFRSLHLRAALAKWQQGHLDLRAFLEYRSDLALAHDLVGVFTDRLEADADMWCQLAELMVFMEFLLRSKYERHRWQALRFIKAILKAESESPERNSDAWKSSSRRTESRDGYMVEKDVTVV